MNKDISVGYSEQDSNLKIHPKMFALYLGMGSMIMFFAALSSALFVKRGDFAHWVLVPLPSIFLYSTFVILISSITIQIAKNNLVKNKSLFNLFSFITFLLGVLFLWLQLQGWNELNDKHIFLNGNPSGSYIYLISGFHGFHYIGGLLFLILLMFLQYRSKTEVSETRKLHFNLLTQYWHFIGLVWVYIYLFFKFIIYN